MKVKISTDSTADIPEELLKKWDIDSVPLSIALEDQEWLDGVTITPQEFYKVLIDSKTLPVSSAIPPIRFLGLFERTWKEGYSDLIHTCLNSKGSSTYQNALMTRDMFYEEHPEAKESFHIHIIDSLTYSMGYGFAVIQAAQLVKQGKDAPAVISFLEDWLAHVLPTCITLDLKFVKKSGRITAAAAFLGEALGLKPIIQFREGSAHIIAKGRGEKHGLMDIAKIARNSWKEGTPYTLLLGNNEEANKTFTKLIVDSFGQEPELITPVGCIISLNTGPNMVGIIFRS